jgi:hypothetical protein
MSAYIVDHDHIDALLSYGIQWHIKCARWLFHGMLAGGQT